MFCKLFLSLKQVLIGVNSNTSCAEFTENGSLQFLNTWLLYFSTMGNSGSSSTLLTYDQKIALFGGKTASMNEYVVVVQQQYLVGSTHFTVSQNLFFNQNWAVALQYRYSVSKKIYLLALYWVVYCPNLLFINTAQVVFEFTNIMFLIPCNNIIRQISLGLQRQYKHIFLDTEILLPKISF